MTSMTKVTPLQVIDAAIERLSEEDGYITNDYHDNDGDVTTSTAHCAIGGVEHGIWKLLREDVTEWRDEVAYAGSAKTHDPEPLMPVKVAELPAVQVYGQVMRVLNEEAVKMFPVDNPDYRIIFDVEDVSLRRSKEDVLAVFQAARRRIHAEES